MKKEGGKKNKSYPTDREYADALNSMKEIILRDGHSVFKSSNAVKNFMAEIEWK